MKNYNIKIWTLTSAFVLSIAFAGVTNAQLQRKVEQKKEARDVKRDVLKDPEAVKPKQEPKEQVVEKPARQNQEKKVVKQEPEVKKEKKVRQVDTIPGNGYAYGGSTESANFGQDRATAAKVNHEIVKKNLNATVTAAEASSAEAHAAITATTEQIEKDKASGKISEAKYWEKKNKLTELEAAVKELDAKIAEGKGLSVQ